MADVSLTAAFSTVPAAEAEEIKRVLVETVEQLARDDGAFKKAKLVFTESDERCGLTAELDGVKKEGVPLQLDLEQLEDAKTGAEGGAPPLLPPCPRPVATRASSSSPGGGASSACPRASSRRRPARCSSVATSWCARTSGCSSSGRASGSPPCSWRARGRASSPRTSSRRRSRRSARTRC